MSEPLTSLFALTCRQTLSGSLPVRHSVTVVNVANELIYRFDVHLDTHIWDDLL